MYHQGHPLTMTQTALIQHHRYVILEVLEPSVGRHLLRVLERSGRVLYLFLNQKSFVQVDVMLVNGEFTRKYVCFDGRGLSFETSYW